MTVSALLLATFAAPRKALAIARPHHQHEDLFDENDLVVGFKVGPQVTMFTPVQTGPAVVDVQSSMRFQAGASFEFVYALPRVEVDTLWNSRGWVNTDDTVNYMAFPVLLKFPVEIDKGIDFVVGAGGQPEVILFGADPHRNFMIGVLGSVGLHVDFHSFVFEFEVRLNVGLQPVSDLINGARNRDLQPLGGLAWHF